MIRAKNKQVIPQQTKKFLHSQEIQGNLWNGGKYWQTIHPKRG